MRLLAQIVCEGEFRGQEKITEQYVAELCKEGRQRDQAVQLQDVLDSYSGKPPASKQ